MPVACPQFDPRLSADEDAGPALLRPTALSSGDEGRSERTRGDLWHHDRRRMYVTPSHTRGGVGGGGRGGSSVLATPNIGYGKCQRVHFYRVSIQIDIVIAPVFFTNCSFSARHFLRPLNCWESPGSGIRYIPVILDVCSGLI